MQSAKRTAIALGIASSLFFSITFIVNRLMSLEGGSWVWSASLRFYWMLPFFIIIVVARGNFAQLLRELRNAPVQWLLWSTTGFGIFYAFLTYAATSGPAWLVASTWQITIIAGMLVSPLINCPHTNKQTPGLAAYLFSGMILLGIVIMQVNHAKVVPPDTLLLGVLPVIVAAFAYPLGNRKLMHLAKGRLDVYQRILGMLICSMPFWLLLSGYELLIRRNAPDDTQYIQTFIVGICSGLIATVMFFSATDKVRGNEESLAAVEATQSTEVVFALAGEVWLLGNPLPDVYAMSGVALVVVGMVLHSTKR
jgi:drug/metabolite transporter (DMT)-like permease